MPGGGSSLLTRIRRPEMARPRASYSEAEVRESILNNLVQMCSTRQGSALTCPDYGIASVSEMVYLFPDAITIMAQSLRHTIQSYEPRLQNVQVVHVPNENIDLTLKFEVRARAVVEGSKTTVKFETALDPTRRLTIR
ncbi:MAG TPA: type VI secretion system baseplate subunit TssE [Polyangiaceae bacterium]